MLKYFLSIFFTPYKIINFNLIEPFTLLNSNHKVKIYDHTFNVASNKMNKYTIIIKKEEV